MRLVELVDLLDALVLCGLARRRWLEVSHLMVLADGHGAILQAGLDRLENMSGLEHVEAMSAVGTGALVFSSRHVGQPPPQRPLSIDRGLVRNALKQRLASHASSNARPYTTNGQASLIGNLLRGPVAFADAVAGCGAHSLHTGRS